MHKIKPRFNWRHQYDDNADQREGDAAILRCEDESLTHQSFTADADLNVIAQRFGLNEIPLGTPQGNYRDTTQDPDLREILEYQRAAKNNFMTLPAKLRMRFHNSPQELWDFVNDPENAEEAVRLGLLIKQPADTPQDTPAAPTPTAAGTTEHPPKPPTGGPTP